MYNHIDRYLSNSTYSYHFLLAFVCVAYLFVTTLLTQQIRMFLFLGFRIAFHLFFLLLYQQQFGFRFLLFQWCLKKWTVGECQLIQTYTKVSNYLVIYQSCLQLCVSNLPASTLSTIQKLIPLELVFFPNVLLSLKNIYRGNLPIVWVVVFIATFIEQQRIVWYRQLLQK